jgi:predicted metal-dependent enzyme (double-stranded beta helix superfamily)
MFDKQQFVDDIRSALGETDAQGAVAEIVERAVSDPAAIIAALGPPGRGRSEQLYADDDLTVSNIIWGTEMWVPPHDHQMWAVIGVYQGQEDNTFWREQPSGLEKMGGVSMNVGDVRKLGANAVHSVTNPLIQLTGAIHVYGGDFFGAIPRRHSWNPETLERGPYDYEYINSLRDEANDRMDKLIAEGVQIS